MNLSFSGKFILILWLISFAFIAIIGLLLSVSKTQHTDLASFRCADQRSCPTATLEHIEHWQQALTTILPTIATIVVLMVIFGTIFAAFLNTQFNIGLSDYFKSQRFRSRDLALLINRLLTGTVQAIL